MFLSNPCSEGELEANAKRELLDILTTRRIRVSGNKRKQDLARMIMKIGFTIPIAAVASQVGQAEVEKRALSSWAFRPIFRTEAMETGLIEKNFIRAVPGFRKANSSKICSSHGDERSC